jgi:hypothetical protein
VFERTLVGKDGFEMEIPYRSDVATSDAAGTWAPTRSL